MKKILALVICLALLCPAAVFSAGEENVTEKLSGIWLSPEQDADVLTTMKEENAKKAEELIAKYLNAPGYARLQIGISDDDEEMKQQVNEMYRVKEDEILKVYYVEENKYAKTYADNNVFRYLISDDYYWFSKVENQYMRYEMDGSIYDYKNEDFSSFGFTTITNEVFEFLKNEEQLISILEQIDMSSVREIKLIVLNQLCTCLYIDCGVDEYIIGLYMGMGYEYVNGSYESSIWAKNIERFKLYTVSEFMQIISDEVGVMNTAKPTYETEAAALQSEGLLLGNENGLDLLKPLSRIEAATMLLRAMGESTESTAQAQTFVDVPATHWGYGAAENAYSLGIVNGMGDDRFAPDENVTAVQFATMLLRAGEYEEFNWEEAVNIMVEGGVITQEEASTMDFFTRGDMAKMLYEARAKGMI